jgi:hypothetical protein
MTTAQFRTYSLIASGKAPPMTIECVEALRAAIKARHVILQRQDGKASGWALTPAGKAEFEFAQVAQ